jgi:hypothetical protein
VQLVAFPADCPYIAQYYAPFWDISRSHQRARACATDGTDCSAFDMKFAMIEAGQALQQRRLQKALAVSALVLVVLGAKIQIIAHFGSSTPFWDQWDAEAGFLYKEYLNSNLTLGGLFAPHNEHRIVLTRVLSLVLFELDGGWDPILQMIVNAALHVCAIVIVALTLQRLVPPRRFLVLVLFIAFVFLPPIGWENVLAGFQSPFYLLLLFSILALRGFANAEAFAMRWWISVGYMVCAFFSLASGALTGLAATIVAVLQIMGGSRQGLKEYMAAAMLLIISVVMMVSIPHIDAHDALKAHSVRELLNAFVTCLSFPLKRWVCIWVNLPMLAYMIYVLVRRPPRGSAHWVVASLAIWWVGQMLSLSYGRAVFPNSSRYLDIIAIGLPINFAVLLFALNVVSVDKQRLAAYITVAWLGGTISGLWLFTVASALPNIHEKASQSSQQQANVIAFLKSGNIADLQNKAMLEIPYPNAGRLASLLSDPIVRMELPRLIRPADIDDSSLFSLTMLKGRFYPLIERTKRAAIVVAPFAVGLGIALAFGAGLAGPSFRRRPALRDRGET